MGYLMPQMTAHEAQKGAATYLQALPIIKRMRNLRGVLRDEEYSAIRAKALKGLVSEAEKDLRDILWERI